MWHFDDAVVPDVRTELPGPKARALLERDATFVSPSYTRVYPLVVERGSGAVVQDVDGNLFLDFTAGIAVTSTGHCHPKVVAAVEEQSRKLLHMSGTDFYYQPQIDLAQRLAEAAPGASAKRVFFTNSGAESIEAALKLARWHTGRSRAVAFFGAFHGRTYGALSLSASKLVHRRGFSPLVPDIHHVDYPRGCDGCRAARDCQCVERMKWPPSSSSRSRGKAAITCRRPGCCRPCVNCAIGTEFCSWPTRSRAAWDGRANFSLWKIGASSRTSSVWRRGSRAACRWGRLWPART
jgi:4-aminobutyrate aminotransferase